MRSGTTAAAWLAMHVGGISASAAAEPLRHSHLLQRLEAVLAAPGTWQCARQLVGKQLTAVGEGGEGMGMRGGLHHIPSTHAGRCWRTHTHSLAAAHSVMQTGKQYLVWNPLPSPLSSQLDELGKAVGAGPVVWQRPL